MFRSLIASAAIAIAAPALADVQPYPATFTTQAE